jgi:hypothetical protein
VERDAVDVRLIGEVVLWVATLGGGFWALWNYHKSAKLERAKWMKELYEKFYEGIELKKIRDLLDEGNPAVISNWVREEPGSFTDYLNFFEFIGYLHESGQISLEEVRGMFDYYLRSLKENKLVADYIADPNKGFEKLQKLLEMV